MLTCVKCTTVPKLNLVILEDNFSGFLQTGARPRATLLEKPGSFEKPGHTVFLNSKY